MYALALLLPPLALLLCGKPFQALFNLVLLMTIVGWFVCAVWSVLVVKDSKDNKRTRIMVNALK